MISRCDTPRIRQHPHRAETASVLPELPQKLYSHSVAPVPELPKQYKTLKLLRYIFSNRTWINYKFKAANQI